MTRQGGNGTGDALATIVVVQRERFAPTRRSLGSLYAQTRPPFDVIYVDAGSPRRIARYLAAESERSGFRLLRFPHHLPPQTARNIGAAAARTRYIAFVDNDVIFSPGWLDALIECAETTQADVVSPLICIGEPVHTTVHVAGGVVSPVEQDGRRRLEEVMRFVNRPLAEVRGTLRREPTELVEFHCVLIRRAFLERIGPLDEAFLATSEHLDLSLTVRQNHGSIFLEPSSVVTYLAPPPLALSDIPYYTLRWSDEWAVASEQHFHRKWNFDYDDRVVRFAVQHRRLAFRRLRRAALAVVGWNRSHRFSDWLDRALIALARRGG
jgi:GT2 family glycosyltransferase